MPIGLNKDKKINESASNEVDDLNTTEETSQQKKKIDPKLLLIVVATVVILLIVFMAFKSGGDAVDDSSEEEVQASTELPASTNSGDGLEDDSGNSVYNSDGTTKDANGINPGITDYDDATNNQTGATVYSASDYIKDLNGLDVSAVYNVESIDFVEDYVSYETRRAITDDGMEMYWLEANYNGKAYRIQIPFYYYRSLGTSGICKVNVEVLTLVGGGKVVSYMQVIQEDD